jgi:hypothetical protein
MATMTIDLSWLCIVIPIGIIVVVAILGTRSRWRYARRIQEAQARGAFADMNTYENKSRFRRLAVMALVGLLGMILSIAILVLQQASKAPSFVGITIASAILFGIIASIAGFLMQREINRRL